MYRQHVGVVLHFQEYFEVVENIRIPFTFRSIFAKGEGSKSIECGWVGLQMGKKRQKFMSVGARESGEVAKIGIIF